jgi:hypothetical protein
MMLELGWGGVAQVEEHLPPSTKHWCLQPPVPPQKEDVARCQLLTPVILATQEAEIRRIVVWNQPGQVVHETLSQKTLSQKK